MENPNFPMISSLISPIFYLSLAKPHSRKLLRLLQSLLISFFFHALYLVQSLPFIYLSTTPPRDDDHNPKTVAYEGCRQVVAEGSSSAVSRALTQLLSVLNDIPVSSRKYEMVKSLAEKLVDENGLDGLNQLNSQALAAAFSNTLSRLEEAAAGSQRGLCSRLQRLIGFGFSSSWYDGNLQLVNQGAMWLRDLVLRWFGRQGEGIRSEGEVAAMMENDKEVLAEKLAAELLWVADRWVACGGARAAVEKWGSASRLARFSLLARPRLQGALVKISAFLIKQARDLGIEEEKEKCSEEKGEQNDHDQQQLMDRMKVTMLLSWLPLLCRGINGTDTPILSQGERGDVERAMEDIIETLEQDRDKEIVLSAWLHHFALCSSSEWPDLYAYYLRWFTDSRRLYISSCC